MAYVMAMVMQMAHVIVMVMLKTVLAHVAAQLKKMNVEYVMEMVHHVRILEVMMVVLLMHATFLQIQFI